MPDHTLKLHNTNLTHLPPNVTIPTYNRGKLKTGIVHVGVGGFHRAHQAYYTNQLLENGNNEQWGICGVGLRPSDSHIQQALLQQDYLYTLVTKHANGNVDANIIGSIHGFLLAQDDPMAIINKMSEADTKMVTLTITEGGYNFVPATGEFNDQHPDVIHDLKFPQRPKLVFGYLVAALKIRKEQGIAPFTIVSCDNIQHNGDVMKKMLLSYAKLVDESLAEWIAAEVAFPNSMVDRITPATTPEDHQALIQQANIVDNWPVICEPFHQWIIEDKFCNERPNWEDVGVKFVADVTPYEKLKLRLLNAGHSILAILGSLYGYHTMDECVNNPLFAKFFKQFADNEATPILDPVPGIDVDEYKATLLERFGNVAIKDTLARIRSESSAKFVSFLIPTLQENLANNGEIKLLTFVLAAWCRFHHTMHDQLGKPLDIIDEMLNELHETAKQTPQDPLAMLNITSIFGDLRFNKRFSDEYQSMITALYDEPFVEKHMERLLAL